jgi:hypothetical protein
MFACGSMVMLSDQSQTTNVVGPLDDQCEDNPSNRSQTGRLREDKVTRMLGQPLASKGLRIEISPEH